VKAVRWLLEIWGGKILWNRNISIYSLERIKHVDWWR